MKAIILILALAAPLVAQTKAPELTTTEKAAIQFLLDKQAEDAKSRASLEAAEKDITSIMTQVQADVVKTHPGYHLTLKPIALVKDEEAKK